MAEKTNIILIGMPAAGKSTVGVLLAKAMQKHFVDTDLLIQQNKNSPLQKLLDSVGLDEFCRIEEECITGLDCRDSVIATGGSAVYSPKAMEHLKKTGIVIYLFLDLSEIEKRLTNIDTRGLVIAKDQTLAQLYNRRKPLYEKYADITIDTKGLTHDQTVIEILKYFN